MKYIVQRATVAALVATFAIGYAPAHAQDAVVERPAAAPVEAAWLEASAVPGVPDGAMAGNTASNQTGVVTPSGSFSIQAENLSLGLILSGLARQTGKNIVIGPNVAGTVTLNLTEVPWQEALDVILKPCGYTYHLVGDTIVVTEQPAGAAERVDEPLGSRMFDLQHLDAVDAREMARSLLSPRGRVVDVAGQGGAVSNRMMIVQDVPAKLDEISALLKDVERVVAQQQAARVVTRVFTLKYLDASDVKLMVETHLSPTGTVTVLSTRGQFWEPAAGGGRGASTGGSAQNMKRRRTNEAVDLVRTKTLIVKDIPSAIESIEALLEEIDRKPDQVLIEARFVEVSESVLRDIGIDFGTGARGAESPGAQAQPVKSSSGLYGMGAQVTGRGVAPAAFKPDAAFSGTAPFDGGLSLVFQQLSDTQFQVLFHMLQEDSSMNVLSAPRIMTLNNQEANILIGEEFPILSSDINTSGNSAVTTLSLEYYERIGIELNVVPQICEGGYINMFINPAVKAKIAEIGDEFAKYPVLSTRETETQIMVKSGYTIVIGGLLEDTASDSDIKVPLLGDIPLLGRLFKRDTKSKMKTDLLIFLTATIMPADRDTPTADAEEWPAVSAVTPRVGQPDGAQPPTRPVSAAATVMVGPLGSAPSADSPAPFQRLPRLESGRSAPVESREFSDTERDDAHKAVQEAAAKAMAKQLGVPFLPLDGDFRMEPAEVALIPEAMARRYGLFAIIKRDPGSALTVVMSDPLDPEAMAAVRSVTSLGIAKAVSTRDRILAVIDKHYVQ